MSKNSPSHVVISGLSARLVVCMEAAGMNVEQLAARWRISEPKVERMLNGEDFPSQLQLEKFVRICWVRQEYVYRGDGPARNENWTPQPSSLREGVMTHGVPSASRPINEDRHPFPVGGKDDLPPVRTSPPRDFAPSNSPSEGEVVDSRRARVAFKPALNGEPARWYGGGAILVIGETAIELGKGKGAELALEIMLRWNGFRTQQMPSGKK